MKRDLVSTISAIILHKGRWQDDGSPNYVLHGFGPIRPYLYGQLILWDFVHQAEELERQTFSPVSVHVEARMGDAMLVMEISDPPYPHGTPGSIYLYVPDIDAAYQRALNLGATSVAEPADKPYQERAGGVRDSFDNIWWLSTYRGCSANAQSRRF